MTTMTTEFVARFDAGLSVAAARRRRRQDGSNSVAAVATTRSLTRRLPVAALTRRRLRTFRRRTSGGADDPTGDAAVVDDGCVDFIDARFYPIDVFLRRSRIGFRGETVRFVREHVPVVEDRDTVFAFVVLDALLPPADDAATFASATATFAFAAAIAATQIGIVVTRRFRQEVANPVAVAAVAVQQPFVVDPSTAVAFRGRSRPFRHMRRRALRRRQAADGGAC